MVGDDPGPRAAGRPGSWPATCGDGWRDGRWVWPRPAPARGQLAGAELGLVQSLLARSLRLASCSGDDEDWSASCPTPTPHPTPPRPISWLESELTPSCWSRAGLFRRLDRHQRRWMDHTDWIAMLSTQAALHPALGAAASEAVGAQLWAAASSGGKIRLSDFIRLLGDWPREEAVEAVPELPRSRLTQCW